MAGTRCSSPVRRCRRRSSTRSSRRPFFALPVRKDHGLSRMRPRLRHGREFRHPPETGNSRAFIVCDRRDDMGLIGLDPSELNQWQLSQSQPADFLVKSLSLAPSSVSVGAPVIALGWTTSKHGRRHVCLQFEGTPQVSIDNAIIPLDQLVFWNGTAIAVDHKSFRLIADQRPQAPSA